MGDLALLATNLGLLAWGIIGWLAAFHERRRRREQNQRPVEADHDA